MAKDLRGRRTWLFTSTGARQSRLAERGKTQMLPGDFVAPPHLGLPHWSQFLGRHLHSVTDKRLVMGSHGQVQVLCNSIGPLVSKRFTKRPKVQSTPFSVCAPTPTVCAGRRDRTKRGENYDVNGEGMCELFSALLFYSKQICCSVRTYSGARVC